MRNVCRSAFLFASLLIALALPGCSGGGPVSPEATPSPTPTPTPSPSGDILPGFTGNYGAQIALTNNRFAVFTLAVIDRAGTARGVVNVYTETQPAAAALVRHTGPHPLVASGQVAGQVDPQTRAMQLVGTLVHQDGLSAPLPIEVTGTLQRFGIDNGQILLRIDTDLFAGAFQ